MMNISALLKNLELEILAFYLRHCRLDKGRWRLHRYAMNAAKKLLNQPRNKRIRTHPGFKMQIDTSDWLGRYVYVTGEYEPTTTKVIHTLLGEGDLFIDVGANVGYFSLLASQCVGESGQVLAFEPVPANQKALKKNLHLNHFNNVQLHDVALSNKIGSCAFYVGPPQHKGISSLRRLNKTASQIKVNTTPLDDLLDHAGHVDMIKIDIEGAETLALQGMTKILDNFKPDIVVEVTDKFLKQMGSSEQELCTLLTDRGYQMYIIEYEGLRLTHPNDPTLPDQYNALFTHRTNLPPELFAHPQQLAA